MVEGFWIEPEPMKCKIAISDAGIMLETSLKYQTVHRITKGTLTTPIRAALKRQSQNSAKYNQKLCKVA